MTHPKPIKSMEFYFTTIDNTFQAFPLVMLVFRNAHQPATADYVMPCKYLCPTNFSTICRVASTNFTVLFLSTLKDKAALRSKSL